MKVKISNWQNRMASLDFEASPLKACKKAAFAIVEAGMWGSEHDTCHEGTKAFKNGAKSRPTLDTTEKEMYGEII